MPRTPRTNRNRLILILLIVVCITVLTLYVRESDSGPLHKIQNFFLDLASPISSAFTKIFRPIKDGFVNLWHLPSLSKDRAELQKEVANLRRQSIESKELESQVEDLRNLLQFSEENVQYEYVGVDVIGQSPDNWQRLMIINKGSSSGVKKYMSVVTDEGLVGRVISVGSRTSVIELITDSRSAIGARDQRSRELGIVEGGNEEIIRYTPMNEEADIKVGDIIETSGLGGTCPPGIAIGRVSEVTKRSGGLTRYIKVKPYARFSKIDKALVIVMPEPESVILREEQ
ncbi:MAG: rod shape-determining protein MreC [Actinomycetota bacterium]